ncbi:helix-turn-helix domain-containing protein [Streptomyces sp. NPDC096013]|uniref:helix-turn-helix domain-containing protein n=1 Tax=Streptomyces sp. NPDC096013 TaxID=3366069 RepID=UPI0037FCEC25
MSEAVPWAGNAAIARETGVHLDTVRTWRVRFAEGGLPALADRRRCGPLTDGGIGAGWMPGCWWPSRTCPAAR